MFTNIILILFSYLLGSIISAVLVCKLSGLPDPRSAGSKNPGATNVMRLYSKKIALFTLIGDILKGVISVLLARFLADDAIIVALCGLAVFLGHLFPVFFRFKGGKGVATLIGVLVVTNWLLGAVYIATWLVSAWLFRYSSLSALVATGVMPIYSLLILQDEHFVLIHLLMTFLLIWRHRSNIQNLISGTEPRIGDKKTS